GALLQPRHDDDGNARVAFAQLGQQRKAVAVRKRQVEQDEAEIALLRYQVHGGRTVGSLQDGRGPVQFLEHAPQRFADQHLIVNHQNFHCWLGPFARHENTSVAGTKHHGQTCDGPCSSGAYSPCAIHQSPLFVPRTRTATMCNWIRPSSLRPMIFRQLFDNVSSTYSYLVASRRGGEALIIDPVLEKVDRYLQLVKELDLKLVKAVDTHLHADHITGLGALRDRTHCVTVMGENAKVDVVSMRVAEGDKITIEGVALEVLYTPGHTDDSCSFCMHDRVFTGDTLLIRGTGRTDFQNGDPRAQYDSIFNKLL